MISRNLYACFFILITWMINAQSDCSISELSVIKSECNSSKKFNVKITFKYANPGGKGFKIVGNGTVYGTFTSLPVVIENLSGNCTTPYEFVVRDIAFPECSASFELGKVCCEASPLCDINMINTSVGECSNNGVYKLNLDALHYNDKGLGFDVYTNGHFHSFHKYTELPLSNLAIESSGLDYETIVICDNDNQKCCDTLSIPSPCKCSISDIQTQVAECSAEKMEYYLRMNFDHHLTSDSFYVAGIGNNSKLYGYNQLPLLVGPISFGTNLDVLIADKNQSLCFQGFEKSGVTKCLDCKLYDPEYEILPCVDEKIYIKLKFKSQNPGVKDFSIKGNGVVYGSHYSYNDGVYYIGPIVPNCAQNYEFVIVDNANPNCKTQVNLSEKLCCAPCEIGNIKFEPFCNPAESGIFLNFTAAGAPTDSFKISINGTVIGTYKKITDPIKLIYPFIDGKNFILEIASLHHPDCYIKKELKFDCTSNLPCGFKDVTFDLTECTEDDQYKIVLRFTQAGVHGEKFYAKINDQLFGPIVYGSGPYTLGPISKSCNGFRLELRDGADEKCNYVIEKDLKKCCEEEDPCNINVESIETICFDNKIIGLKLLVPGKEGNAYRLWVDGAEMGLFKYASFPVLVNITPRAEGKFVIKLIDIANPSCFLILEPSLNCNNCIIGDIQAKGVDCTNQSVKLSINFNPLNTYSDSLVVVVNTTKIGTFHKNNQPIVTNAFPRGITYKIRIFDATKESCQGIKEVKEVECTNGLSTLTWDKVNIFNISQGLMLENLQSKDQYTLSIYAMDGRMISKYDINQTNTQYVPLNINTQLVIAKLESAGESISKLILIK